MEKPNVLLLTLDTLRWDMLSCYAHTASPTPRLDHLASTGFRFEQAITGGSWTQAAFPVIMTSTYASMYGGCLGPLSPERPSPIESLTASGYNTAGFSTNPHLSRRKLYNRGFQIFHDLAPAEGNPPLRRIKGGQRLLRQPLTHNLLRLAGQRMRPPRLYSSAADVTEHVCRWLSDVKAPFFGWAHYMDLHWPYHLEETLEDPVQIARAWQDLAIMYGRSNFHGETITADQRDYFVALYVQSLQFLDAQIGRLLDYLDSSSLSENTIVVLVSDHGEEFLDHGRWGHWESNLYDEILRVPLIIRLPGHPGRQVIKRQVRLLDLMPTILDFCSCPSPEKILGTSLTPLLRESEERYEVDTAISEMQRDIWHRVAVRTEKFKYVWDSKKPNQPVLYDLSADSGEKQNVSAAYPQEGVRFQAQVEAHLHCVSQTESSEVLLEPEIDEEVAQRLRDLGYID
jgi:arylsulfatase A-like enzyme